jgi:uncharacterized protein (DUF58 family)
LRHGRLLVRQFETETDRALRLVVDASASMSYRGTRAHDTKLGVASLAAAALARIAIASGDPVGLSYLGGTRSRPVAVTGGREGFDRVLGSLEDVRPAGDAVRDPAMLDRALATLARAARRGSVIVVASDFLDLPPETPERLAALAAGGRSVVALQLLDPDELDLPFDGTVRLRALEGDDVVETDTAVTRDRYLGALAELQGQYRETLLARGGHLVVASTSDDPVGIVRSIVAAVV